MADHDELERLERRLKRESLGPLTEISNQMTTSALSLIRAAAGWLRGTIEQRPLISLLIAFEAGFVIARLGGHHAKR